MHMDDDNNLFTYARVRIYKLPQYVYYTTDIYGKLHDKSLYTPYSSQKLLHCIIYYTITHSLPPILYFFLL